MKENVVATKSMAFAVRIVKLSRYLRKSKREYELASQVLRSGTSIGANVHEAVYAHSRREFLAKMQIALKEANETKYWLELLCKSEVINFQEYASIIEDSEEMVKLLVSITKTTKEQNN